ncbi:leucine carboxyl methyltransferase 1-like [Liolophura sinensis]|uniref:leucine carboxyl methyltransferase 1-like n=1 Tax=Liolophura sinensis TaxID=3198878 RepID=UPI003158973A
MASDDAIRATNDDATQCKRFAVQKGYWSDPYIQHFVSRGQNTHAPEINRGYYARVASIRILMEKFLKLTKCQCQVVNLGAGFDTTFWRLKEQGMIPQSFIEMDFPTVVMRKGHAIKQKKPLLAGISTEDGEIKFHNYDLHSANYHLVGANLRTLGEVEAKLTECGIDYTLPTIFIAECVLVYLEIEQSKALLKWLAEKFQTAFFINYEQVNLGDRFGEVMLANLKSRECTLAGVDACLSLDAQKDRFLTTGWQGADGMEMTYVYKCLPHAEITRIEHLEFLDERELLDQLFNHYCVVWAYKDSAGIGLDKINFGPS